MLHYTMFNSKLVTFVYKRTNTVTLAMMKLQLLSENVRYFVHKYEFLIE